MKAIQTVAERDQELKNAGSRLVVIDFYADWCGPCRAIAPLLEKIEKENENVMILKVNVDDAPDLAEEHEISAMPTFEFYVNGEKVDSFTGASKDKLNAVVSKHTGK